MSNAFIRRVALASLALVALSSTACTLINNQRLEAVIDCDGKPNGTVCGNQFDDGVARVCVANACVVAPCTGGQCSDGGTDAATDGATDAQTSDGNVDAGPLEPVDTLILAKPDAISGPDVSFEFQASIAGSTFECIVDLGFFTACPTPFAIDDLTEGSHTLQVRAKAPAGNVDDSPSTYTWTVEVAHLDTTITAGPTGTTGRNPSFSFNGNLATSFECKLDGATAGTWAPCTSPKAYTSLAEDLSSPGYTFSVRAVGAGGTTDDTPATRDFLVDGTGPTVTIPTVASPTNLTTIDLTVSASEPGSTFLCKLNTEATFTACAAHYVKDRLLQGAQLLSVKAVDAYGNEGPVAMRSWTINPIDTTIYAIRTTLIAQGTRVRLLGNGGTNSTRMSRYWNGMLFVQETSGNGTLANTVNRGITVHPRAALPANAAFGVPVEVVGTVLLVDDNLTLVDADLWMYTNVPMPLYAAYTNRSVVQLNSKAYEGMYVGTSGPWVEATGECFGLSSHIEPCDDPGMGDICGIFDDAVDDTGTGLNEGSDYNYTGVLYNTSAGFRLYVDWFQQSSDACL